MKRNVEKFFAYARERHSIFMMRATNQQRPWTDDKILSQYKFTNVFRELDRTTQWYAEHVRRPLLNKPETLLATVVFRLFNRISTGEAIFCQTDLFDGTAFELFLKTGNVKCLKKAILANCGKGPYVTGAYIISSPPGYSKLDGMLKVIGSFHKKSNWYDVAEEMRMNPHALEGAWEWLRKFKYFGPFHAYEIVTDLRHTALLRNAPDIMTWANPGPGAHRGANRIFRNDKRKKVGRAQVIDEMQFLLKMSTKPMFWPRTWPKWEMRDVEHTLCEFDKYERVRKGEGRPRGVYR